MSPLEPIFQVNELLLEPFPCTGSTCPVPQEEQSHHHPSQCELGRSWPCRSWAVMPPDPTWAGAAEPGALALHPELRQSQPSPGEGFEQDGAALPRSWFKNPEGLVAAASWVSTHGSGPAQPVLPLPVLSWSLPGSKLTLVQEEIAFLAPRNTFAGLDGRFPRDFSKLY